ncbi:hypothetical protein B0H21DRAFT_729575 [Amylocystis lapponica]|nr:hypothetical protein B0H21DRAFT_729575 [Amylocystis lapponica]
MTTPTAMTQLSSAAAAAHYPCIELYPSSPLRQFPPPLTPVHTMRPLRERCGFNLQIKTSFSHSATPAPWSPKGHGHLQPHRNHLPRRRKTKRITFYDDESASPPQPTPAPAPVPPLVPAPVPVPAPEEQRHLQEVVPGLFFAFHTPADTTSNRALEAGYTHLVDVCLPTGPDAPFAGASEQAFEGTVHRLRLVLPAAALAPAGGRAGLALTDAQLRTARDFLAQALPYGTAAARGAAGVRVLLTTPPHRPTDAMAIAGCYLAFASGKGAETVLRYVDEEESFLSVWKGEVSGEEMERVERVARMWSWLSGIRR